MIKKMLAHVLSILIVFALFAAVPVGAETTVSENLAQDYTAGNKTGNMIPGDGSDAGNVINTTYVYNGFSPSWWHSAGNTTDAIWVKYNSSFGTIVNTANIAAGHAITPQVTDTTQTGNVVFSFNAKKENDNATRINLGRLRDNGTVEYGYDIAGYEPEKNVYNKFTGTFADTGAAASEYTKYVLGFVDGSVTGAQYWFKTADAYIGYEYAYDMTVTADKKNLQAGDTITVDAEITNQIGNTYGGLQNVKWYALTKNRTATAPGFTVTQGEDGAATIKTDERTVLGTYYLVAEAEANTNLVKSIEITVTGRDFSDYVPGDAEGNEITNLDALLSPNYTPFDLTSIGTTDEGTDDEAWTFETIEDISEDVIGVNGQGAAGASIVKNSYDADSLLKAGKNIIISAKVRATRGTPTIQAAMYQYGIEPTFPVEYPEGMKVDGSHWQDFTATIHIPETGWKGAYNTNFYFGYAYTGLVDECERVLAVKKNSFYIGEEYAYDMKVSANVKNCIPGRNSTFTVESSVINQVGSTGYLDQNVTWYALNDERTAYAEGITVVPNTDGTATVNVSSTVLEGTYDIVAVSDTYDKLQKGVSISVGNPYLDYEPDDAMAGNFIADSYTGDVFTNVYHTDSNGNYVGVSSSDGEWTLSITGSVPEGVSGVDAHGVSGARISRDAYDKKTYLAEGKKIVIGAKVKKSSSWYGNAVIKAGMYHLNSTPIFPAEYPNASDGFTVSSTSWQDFGATIQIPESGWRGESNTDFYLGFAYGQSLKAIKIDGGSLYIGEERAYDIKVTADKTQWTEGETTAINLNADIVNQVGTTGYLNQNVTWHALNATRTTVVPGITIKENADGTAVLTVADSVSPGNYDIVAVSDGYEELVRGVTINVVTDEEPIERVTVFELTETGGVAKLTAAVTDSDATEIFFAIASYDENNKMIESNVLPVTVADGIATVSGLSVDKVVDGMKVRGFVWENKTWRPIGFAEGIENIVIIKEAE